MTPWASATTVDTSALLTTKKIVAIPRIAGRSSGPNGRPLAWPSGMSVKCSSTEAAATETAYCAALKASFLAGLPLIRSATMQAPTRPTMATAGPPASISASAKQVEVVTSPSDPRVWTLSGTSSPTSAHSAKRASSGVSSRSRVSRFVPITQAAQVAPSATTKVT